MMKILYVGMGGFLGAILRYVVSGVTQSVFHKPDWPVGTFVVNMIGCVFIGFLMGLVESRQMLTPEVRLLLITGLLGGLTTFSTFAYESTSLLRDGGLAAALLNIALHITIGMMAVVVGLAISRVM
mgnify:CR=1 FL=1